MSGIALTIDAEDLELLGASVQGLGDALTGRDLLLIAGRAVQQVAFHHFAELSRDTQHHETAAALGAERTGFYEKAAQSVHSDILEEIGVEVEGSDAVAISIDGPVGLAQRYFGGTIEAKPGGYLTIPARAESYGKRASEFSDLKLVIFGDTGLAALVEPKVTPLKRKRGEVPSAVSTYDEGDVYYWLVKSVSQLPDPTVLPEEDEMLDPAILAVRDQIALAWDRIKA